MSVAEAKPEMITIKICEQNGNEQPFRIKKTVRMQKVFDKFAKLKNVQLSSMRFLLDGERIDPTKTPEMMEMEDQDQIDCLFEQIGGGRKSD